MILIRLLYIALDYFRQLFLSTIIFFPASTIIFIELVAVVLWFLEHVIDFVMDKAAPSRCCVARRNLRRIFFKMSLEMRCTFTASQ